MTVDAVSLEVFRNLLASVAEEMGVALGRTAYSANMKERRDYSCAVFDAQGAMVAQAAHIPVHLGAMTASVESALRYVPTKPGDIVILNDPYLGGTHLPDITLVAPVYLEEQTAPVLAGYVANRGHHADIGGMSPGSLPISTELYQEGIIIPPLKLVEGGRLNESLLALICRNSRTPEERRGDFAAQIAAIRTGERRLLALAERYSLATVHEHMAALLDYSETLTRAAVAQMPAGRYAFTDVMDDDGLTDVPQAIACTAVIEASQITFDFSGTAAQSPGCINAPLAVTESAALYVVRCLTGHHIPANDGCRRVVTVVAPRDSLVNASPAGAVSGGNVETSQRIVDVLLGCLAQALPHLVPAASQGTMNNVLVGGHNPATGRAFVYYETVGGGMGGGPDQPGASGVQSHMTNTLNTPIEALEFEFPMRVSRYGLRRGSGGRGQHQGGDGIVREMEFLVPAHLTILSERRRSRPYGLQGGEPGQAGENALRRRGAEDETPLPAKVSLDAAPGDLLSLRTPGGGGLGAPSAP